MTHISLENVSYVPRLPMDDVGIGRHSEMILPNSSTNPMGRTEKNSYFRRKKKIPERRAKPVVMIEKTGAPIVSSMPK